jgi:hypothetical protein
MLHVNKSTMLAWCGKDEMDPKEIKGKGIFLGD